MLSIHARSGLSLLKVVLPLSVILSACADRSQPVTYNPAYNNTQNLERRINSLEIAVGQLQITDQNTWAALNTMNQTVSKICFVKQTSSIAIVPCSR
jgi:hypothetical protein